MTKKKQEITLTAEDYYAEFGGYTGSDYETSGRFYPNLVILQNAETLKNFVDGQDVKMSAFGSIFVRSANKNHSSDLRSSLSGTIIKEQKGAELWLENRQVEHLSGRFYSQQEKEILMQNYGIVDNKNAPRNIVKLLIKLDEKMVLQNGEEFEYVILTVKGASFGNYFDFKNQQKSLLIISPDLRAMKVRNIDETVVTFWHILLNTKTETFDHDGVSSDSFLWNFDVELNSWETVKSLKDDLQNAKDFDLITMKDISESVESENIESVETVKVIEAPKIKNLAISIEELNNMNLSDVHTEGNVNENIPFKL